MMSIMHSHHASGSSFVESTAIRLRTPKRLTVTHGRLWLTIEGDRRDYFPAPGTRIVLPADRLIVIQGDADANWQVQPIAQPRVEGWLAGLRESWLALQGAIRNGA